MRSQARAKVGNKEGNPGYTMPSRFCADNKKSGNTKNTRSTKNYLARKK